ncbi:LysM peptidoglycan-binding domain-containing protein [Ferruginibacter lapsinanis]|uniref:glucosaminidase domain-containing protein n=1 Tax=Ferruginibacter lapsinanis TaxID=563172 RepID=UPI001E508999|nr:glucosaminidase domain-containing protein [Ferruginibacter lapsinanis]UEG48556.1 LysM peptidoglycan-binding domain-containing protein [Ferruginibacter lapsinanis]
MKRSVLIGIILLINTALFSQTITPEQYIALYKDIAIREMKRMGVPAAITLAQGILETESGNSALVKKSNNHFGIKCKTTWTASGVSHDDDAPGECFRVYKTAEDSYRDHSNFLRAGERYAFLFRLNPLDYKQWAEGLKKAGYATNPNYPKILIKHIEQYNLQQYSLAAVDEVPKFNSEDFTDDKEPPAAAVVDEERVVTAVATPAENTEKTTLDLKNATTVINGSKCVFAKKGTSLLVIASKNNINLSKLLEYNDLGEDGLLSKDQIIFLQHKKSVGNKDFYISQDGETLYDVAQNNGITYQALLTYNNLKEDTKLYPGTKLFLKSIKTNDQTNKIVKPSSAPKYYEVQPKEGLYSIAKKNGVKVQQLMEWNNLTTDSLKIGQQLIVSQ